MQTHVPEKACEKEESRHSERMQDVKQSREEEAVVAVHDGSHRRLEWQEGHRRVEDNAEQQSCGACGVEGMQTFR